MQSARYTIIDGVLYRRGYFHPLLKCLSATEAHYVLREIHEGVCGNHSGGRVLAHKAMRAGYYWPTMGKDSVEFVRSCDKCQRFAQIMENPPEKLNSVLSPWPFAKWGVDLVGPMPPEKGKKKFLVVAVDYFTKWAEAEALALVTASNVINFLWRSVDCRFGIPHALVTDNGAQFDGKQFWSWCAKLGIRNHYSTPVYPKSNGQVEATNKTLLGTLKKKLDRRKRLWVECVPEVLWSYRTTEGIIGGREYDAQAVGEAYCSRVAKYYNKAVNARKFQVGDWVLRKENLMTRDSAEGKLAAKWEGPYRVIKCH
jgi:hypothetical protein